MNSICLTTYNGERFIKELIKSILPQLNKNDEIIVSDDGSTDSTVEILKEFNDNRIKIFHHIKDNKFPAFSFNKITRNFEYAISQSKGNIIFLVDQDDIWLPEKIEVTTSLLKNNLLVLHDCSVIDQDSKFISESYFELNKSKKGFINNIINSAYLGCCMAFKRELLTTSFPLPKKPVPHDIWFGLLAEWENKVVFCDKKLLLYRRHINNQSTSGEKSRFSIKMRIQYRIILIIAFIKRIIFSS